MSNWLFSPLFSHWNLSYRKQASTLIRRVTRDRFHWRNRREKSRFEVEKIPSNLTETLKIYSWLYFDWFECFILFMRWFHTEFVKIFRYSCFNRALKYETGFIPSKSMCNTHLEKFSQIFALRRTTSERLLDLADFTHCSLIRVKCIRIYEHTAIERMHACDFSSASNQTNN